MPLPAITSHYELSIEIAAPAAAVYGMLLRPELHCELMPFLESIKTLRHTLNAAGQHEHVFIARYRLPVWRPIRQVRFFSYLVELQCTQTELNTGVQLIIQGAAPGGTRLHCAYRLHEKSSVTALQERLTFTSPKWIHPWAADISVRVHQGLLNGIKYKLEHERIMTAEHVRPFTSQTLPAA